MRSMAKLSEDLKRALKPMMATDIEQCGSIIRGLIFANGRTMYFNCKVEGRTADVLADEIREELHRVNERQQR